MKILTFLLLLVISTQVFSQKKTKTRTADCSWAYSVVDDFTGKEKNALKRLIKRSPSQSTPPLAPHASQPLR